MKKQFIKHYSKIFVLVILFSSSIYASMQIRNKTITSGNGLFTVDLQTTGLTKNEKALIVRDENKKEVFFFKLDELPSLDFKNITFAPFSGGYYWYNNAIMFFNENESIVIIRLKDSNLILVDLYNGKILKDIPGAEKLYIEKRIIEQAQLLIKARDLSDKETGAIICGQLKLKETIPDLKKLLIGNTGSIEIHDKGDKTFKVYTVRRAAKQALESMGEKVDAVIMEEDTTFRHKKVEYKKKSNSDQREEALKKLKEIEEMLNEP